METLESRAETTFGQKISQWAAENKVNLAYVKFTGAKGWPDRIVTWGRYGVLPRMIWIEWKRRGERPRPLQMHIHQELRRMGHDVRVYDDWQLALDEIQAEIRATL
jgi:hypothetical protein